MSVRNEFMNKNTKHSKSKQHDLNISKYIPYKQNISEKQHDMTINKSLCLSKYTSEMQSFKNSFDSATFLHTAYCILSSVKCVVSSYVCEHRKAVTESQAKTD